MTAFNQTTRFVKRKSRRWGSSFLLVVTGLLISIILLRLLHCYWFPFKCYKKDARVVDQVKAAIAKTQNKQPEKEKRKAKKVINFASSDTTTLSPDISLPSFSTIPPTLRTNQTFTPKPVNSAQPMSFSSDQVNNQRTPSKNFHSKHVPTLIHNETVHSIDRFNPLSPRMGKAGNVSLTEIVDPSQNDGMLTRVRSSGGITSNEKRDKKKQGKPKYKVAVRRKNFMIANSTRAAVKHSLSSRLNVNELLREASEPRRELVAATFREERQSKLDIDPFRDGWKTVNITGDHVPGSGLTLRMYSAYSDDRTGQGMGPSKVVRIQGVAGWPLIDRQAQLRCLFRHTDGSFSETRVYAIPLPEHFNLPLTSVFISCMTKKRPGNRGNGSPLDAVTVVARSLNDDRPPEDSKKLWESQPSVQIHFNVMTARATNLKKNGLCVKPIYGKWDNPLRLVEFIEMYRLLGVDHFLFYNHSIGEKASEVLGHYKVTGCVTLLDWNLPVASNRKMIRTEAMFTSINDCIVRSVNRFKYLAVVDLDEFISPSINASTSGSVVKGEGIKLFDLLDDLDRELSVGSFVFANVFHYTSWPSIQENNVSSSSIPDLVTQTKVMRKTISEPHGKRSKYVVRPEGVMLAGNHAVHRLAKVCNGTCGSPTKLTEKEGRCKVIESYSYRKTWDFRITSELVSLEEWVAPTKKQPSTEVFLFGETV